MKVRKITAIFIAGVLVIILAYGASRQVKARIEIQHVEPVGADSYVIYSYNGIQREAMLDDAAFERLMILAGVEYADIP